jgi:hypothetical protein
MPAMSADQVDRVLDRLAEFGHPAFGQSLDVETGELGGVGVRSRDQRGRT